MTQIVNYSLKVGKLSLKSIAPQNTLQESIYNTNNGTNDSFPYLNTCNASTTRKLYKVYTLKKKYMHQQCVCTYFMAWILDKKVWYNICTALELIYSLWSQALQGTL